MLCTIRFSSWQLELAVKYSLPDNAPNEFVVKTREKDFSIGHYPLEQSSFLYDMMEARKKFDDDINMNFDYTLFRYRLGFDLCSSVVVYESYNRTFIMLRTF